MEYSHEYLQVNYENQRARRKQQLMADETKQERANSTLPPIHYMADIFMVSIATT